MPSPTLAVYLDTTESRVSRDRIVALADGRHWDTLLSTAYIDSITRTAFLKPLYKTAAWATTTTGLYRRLGKADFVFDQAPYTGIGLAGEGTPGSPDKWTEHNFPYTGNIYLTNQGVNDRAITSATWPKNQPFLLSWFSYNAGQTSQIQIDCGWLSKSGNIALRFWTDGKCEIYKNNIQVGEGNIFERKVTSQTVYGTERDSYHRPKAGSGDSRQQAQQVVELMIIPCRRRDLLLISNQGGGFRFTFEDLDPENPDNEITPADCNFFWAVPTGQATVLTAPLRYASSGYVLTEQRVTRLVPQTGETPDLTVYADGTGGTVSLYNADGSAPFVPDGSARVCRPRVDMAGDGTTTPFVYGASAIFGSQFTSTDGSTPQNIINYVLGGSLSVPESGANTTFSVTCREPGAVDNFVPSASVLENRPMVAGFGPNPFFFGRGKPPAVKTAVNDVSSRLTLEFRDYCQALENYRINDPVPVDGLDLADGMKHFLRLAGLTDGEMDIPAFGFPLPTVGQTSEGEFALLPEVGDKALDWFVKLWEQFAPHTEWVIAPVPGGRLFRVRTIDDLNAAPSLGVSYLSIPDALAAGLSPNDAYKAVATVLDPHTIPCEANDIWVTGRDPRTGKPFQKHYADLLSQKPDLPPSKRPLNWLGEVREYGLVDGSITDEATAVWVCMTLARRKTPVRYIYEWHQQQIIKNDGCPLWRGDKWTINGIGNVRVLTLAGQFDREVSDPNGAQDAIWRPFTYCGELVLPSPV